MASNDLSASALFNVNGLVALVTGGGSGEFQPPLTAAREN